MGWSSKPKNRMWTSTEAGLHNIKMKPATEKDFKLHQDTSSISSTNNLDHNQLQSLPQKKDWGTYPKLYSSFKNGYIIIISVLFIDFFGILFL